jgi:hypothetical protein
MMFALSRLSIWAAVGGLVILGGYSLPVRAEEPVQYMGPVGPNEAILTSVGNKRFIAFYEPDGSNCGLNVVMWDSADDSGDSPARVRVSLNAYQTVSIDSPDNKSVSLECGDFAGTLKIVENKLLTAGAAQ